MIVWYIDVAGTIVIGLILICFAVYGVIIVADDIKDLYQEWSFNRKLKKIEKRIRKSK